MSYGDRTLAPATLLARHRDSNPPSVFESLEPRQLLAAVSWDGGAFTPNWHDPLNWSNDAIPTVADDVTIPATALASINYTATTGARAVNSLNSAENIAFSGGTLTVVTTATTTAPVTLSGGTLSGGSWSPSSLSVSSGTLANVALSGDINVGPSSILNVTGTTTFNVARLTEGADIRFSPGYTLNSTVRAEGTGSNTRTVTTTAAGTLTIGATGLIEIAADTSGSLTIGNSNTTLINNGTIANNATGRTLTINAATLSNHSGTTLTGGTWRAGGGTLNLGTGRNVTTNAANLVLDGTTSSITGLTGLATNNGTITLAGTRDLAVGGFTNNGTLNLDAGSELSVNGSYTQSGSASLHLMISGTATTQMGRIIATNAVNLAGAWTVGSLKPFIPAFGTIFDLVIGGSRIGTFTSFASGSVPGGRFVELSSPSAARVIFDRATGLWTGLGDGINWSNPSNWYNNTLPGPSDDALISVIGSDPVIVVDSGVRSVGSLLSTEHVSITSGATLALGSTLPSSFEAPLTINGTLSVADEARALGGGTLSGSVTLAPGSELELDGSHVFAASSTATGTGTIVVLGSAAFSGSLSASLSLGILDAAFASLNGDYALNSIVNAGTLAIASHSISLSSSFTQSSSGTLEVDLVDLSTIGSITAPTASLGGGLSVASSTGFDPSNPLIPGFGLSVFNSPGALGSLAVTSSPPLAIGSLVARTGPSGVRLLHNVADFNGDGGVDADDVIAFFAVWDSGLSLGDITGDGGVDSDDVILFFQLWDSGGL